MDEYSLLQRTTVVWKELQEDIVSALSYCLLNRGSKDTKLPSTFVCTCPLYMPESAQKQKHKHKDTCLLFHDSSQNSSPISVQKISVCCGFNYN